jgi:hypothetical protein
VSLCLYALIAAFLPLAKAPLVVIFCNNSHLSRPVGLNLFNVVDSATFHCFLQLWEQDEIARSKVRGVGRVWRRRNVVFRQKFICGDSPVSRGVVVVQDPIAGTPILVHVCWDDYVEIVQDKVRYRNFLNLRSRRQPSTHTASCGDKVHLSVCRWHMGSVGWLNRLSEFCAARRGGFLLKSWSMREFLGEFALLASVISVCPYVCNNSAPTGRIFTKFDIWVFFQIWGQNYSVIKIWQA